MRGICPQCGAPHKEDDERCAYCGYYFPKKKTESYGGQRGYGNGENKKSYWPAAAIGGVALVAAAIVTLSNAGSSSKSSYPDIPSVTAAETEVVRMTGGTRFSSPYYKQFAELVFKKPAGEITAEELDQIKVMISGRDSVSYSFTDPDEDGYQDSIQTVKVESGEQDGEDLLLFRGLVKLEADSLPHPSSLAQLPKLKSLTVRYFGRGNTGLTEYSELTGLVELSVKGSELTELEGIEKLTNLKKLTLDSTGIQTLSLLSSMSQIEYLGIIDNENLKAADTVANMAGLKGLEIKGDRIDNLAYLKNCKNLETLSIQDTSIKSIAFLSDLVNLKELTLLSNQQLRDGTPISGCANLTRLSLDETSMDAHPDLSGCTNLVSLNLVGADTLEDLSGAVKLEELTIKYGTGAGDLSALASMTNLRRLVIDQCNTLKSFAPLTSHSSLKELVINQSNVYFDATNLYTIQGLESLSIAECTIGGDISRIGSLSNLRELNLTHVSPVTNIEVETDGFVYSYWWDEVDLEAAIQSYSSLTNLTSLSLKSNKLNNIDFAESLVNLEYLDVADNYIANLDFVGNLKNLKYLNIYSNPLEDYTAVDQLVNVTVVGR